MKKVVSHETLLNFLDSNQEFHVYTDASDYQLGAVVIQKRKPHGPIYVNIKGENNVVADALSRLDKEKVDAKIPEGKLIAMCLTRIDHNEGSEEPPLHCFASLTDEELERFPVSPPSNCKEQHKETNLRQKLLKSHGDSKVSQKN